MKSIRPYLLVGPGVLASDVPQLRRAGITAVLSLQEPGVDLLASAVEQMRSACEPGIAFRNVAVRDYDPYAVIEALPEVLGDLRSLVAGGHTVYVHCSEGINRSPSVALSYLVRHENLSVTEARAVVARAHPSARPYEALLEWLNGEGAHGEGDRG